MNRERDNAFAPGLDANGFPMEMLGEVSSSGWSGGGGVGKVTDNSEAGVGNDEAVEVFGTLLLLGICTGGVLVGGESSSSCSFLIALLMEDLLRFFLRFFEALVFACGVNEGVLKEKRTSFLASELGCCGSSELPQSITVIW